MIAKISFASTFCVMLTEGICSAALASFCAMAFACAADFNHKLSFRTAENWAAIKRDLECSCINCLRIYFTSFDIVVLKKTTASPNIMPFLVPPKLKTSIPTSFVMLAGVHPKYATAFARRAPSM